MAKLIARSSPSTAPSRASTRAKRPSGGAKPPALAQRARRVAAGDVADTRDGTSVQAGRVARATERTQTVAAMALSDLLQRRGASDVHAPGNFVDQLNLRTAVDPMQSSGKSALARV